MGNNERDETSERKTGRTTAESREVGSLKDAFPFVNFVVHPFSGPADVPPVLSRSEPSPAGHWRRHLTVPAELVFIFV